MIASCKIIKSQFNFISGHFRATVELFRETVATPSSVLIAGSMLSSSYSEPLYFNENSVSSASVATAPPAFTYALLKLSVMLRCAVPVRRQALGLRLSPPQ